MERVNESNLYLIHSALTHFIGEPITHMQRFEDSYVFNTARGLVGTVVSNYLGNMDIWIGDDVVYEIEKELYDLLEYESREYGLIEFYNELKRVDHRYMQAKSQDFFNIMKTSTENIILNYNNLELVGDAVINQMQIHYTKNSRIKINLN